jgi:hypothetical protein
MSRVWLDRDDRQICVGIGACVHPMTREQASELYEQLGEALAPAESPTRRDTPLAMAATRPSTSGFKAVTVEKILNEGKEPPKSQG